MAVEIPKEELVESEELAESETAKPGDELSLGPVPEVRADTIVLEADVVVLAKHALKFDVELLELTKGLASSSALYN